MKKSEYTKIARRRFPQQPGGPGPAFRQLHRFRLYEVDDKYFTWDISKITFKPDDLPHFFNTGPVFPYFLEADFSSYKGFREFTNLFGFEWLTPFSQKLKTHLEDTKPDKLSRTFLEGEVFPEMKQPLWTEQAIMERFKRLVFENDAKEFLTSYEEGAELDLTSVGKLVEDRLHSAMAGIRYEPEGFNWFPLYLNEGKEPGLLHYKNVFPSVVDLCYLEIVHAYNYGLKPRICDNCKRLFLPERSNEKYCERLDPDVSKFTPKQTPTKGNAVLSSYKQHGPVPTGFSGTWMEIDLAAMSCRGRGRAASWQKSMSKEMREYQAEKKRRLSRLSYLKSKIGEDHSDYRTARKGYEEWVVENKPAKSKKAKKKRP